jgi:putative spermidine/putrescine transport system permease protein
MDLGATGWQTVRYILLPQLATALLAGGMLAFALSFDEVIVTLFTAGPGTQTVPMWIYTAISGLPTELPVVNVVALFLLILSVIPVYIAQRITGGEAAGTRV